MPARPFTDVLAKIRAGEAVEEIDKAFHRLNQAVSASGMKGTMTIKVTVEPAQKGTHATQVFVDADVAIKEPRPTKQASLFFVDPQFNLTRRDPRQDDLLDGPRAVVGDAEDAKSEAAG